MARRFGLKKEERKRKEREKKEGEEGKRKPKKKVDLKNQVLNYVTLT